MKKLFFYFAGLLTLAGCSNQHYLSVSFLQPTQWNGREVPPSQSCRKDAGRGSTPPLYVSRIPHESNLLILEINNLDIKELNSNGGNGSIGYYHNGESATILLPVPGETFKMPDYAFEEKASRVNPAKPYPYMPPCIERNQRYSATVKAVRRTGSFDKQKTEVLGIGEIYLGRY